MNCHECTELLDGLDPAALMAPDAHATLERIAAHAASCIDCTAALLAVKAIGADAMPRAVAHERLPQAIEAGLLAAAPRPGTASRGARIGLVAGTFALAGAVFAAASWYVLGGGSGWNATSGHAAASRPDAESVIHAVDEPALPRTARDRAAAALLDFVAAEENTGRQNFSLSLQSTSEALSGEYFLLLIVPPQYPAAAVEQGLEGSVVVEFTVDENGDVVDPMIVSASDPVFEAPAIEAVMQIKYKPRVVDGKTRPVPGVRYVLRFQLQPDADVAPITPDEPPADASVPNAIDTREFSRLLAPAFVCLQRDDLRCIELILDEMVATYSLTPAQAYDAWRIYGFVHLRRGQYERAIEAYRNAVDQAENNRMRAHALMIVARILYERREYQEALDAAIEYLKVTPIPPSLDDYVFVDQLRALGARTK